MIKSLTTLLILGLTLIGAPISARPAEVSVEKQQLLAAGQTVDANAAEVGSGRATSKLVEQWQGTTFTFDKGDQPRELTAEAVQYYRAQGLGYGGISILLALAANQDGTDPKSVNEILAMRQSDSKMGWGNVAKALGYKSLGEVVSSVRRSDPTLKTEKTEKGARSETTAKIDKADHPNRPDKVEKVKIEKVERLERLEKFERPERKIK